MNIVNKMIKTFGDGYIHPHNFIKWPQILKLLCNDVVVKNHAAIGASNEWIADQVLKQDFNKNNLYLIQWTSSNRHDFIVTEELKKVIQTDLVYKNNIYENWWCSSESKTDFIFDLKKHISVDQMKSRSLKYVLLIQNLLDSLEINYRFMSTYNIDWLTDHPAEKFVNWDKWIWHEQFQGMSGFSLNFKKSQKFVQPTPYIQYKWITNVLRPKLDLNWNEDKIQSVGKNLLALESKYH